MARFLTDLAVKVRGRPDFKFPASTRNPDMTTRDFKPNVEKVETERSWKSLGKPAQSKQLASGSVVKLIPPPKKMGGGSLHLLFKHLGGTDR